MRQSYKELKATSSPEEFMNKTKQLWKIRVENEDGSIHFSGETFVYPKNNYGELKTKRGQIIAYLQKNSSMNDDVNRRCIVTDINGSLVYILYFKGYTLHRDKGPAQIFYHQSIDNTSEQIPERSRIPSILIWYTNGKVHNDRGPAHLMHRGSNAVDNFKWKNTQWAYEFWIDNKNITDFVKKWCKVRNISIKKLRNINLTIMKFELELNRKMV